MSRVQNSLVGLLLTTFYFSSKVDSKVADTNDEVEPNVSLVEELQTKLHELEVRYLYSARIEQQNHVIFAGNNIFLLGQHLHFCQVHSEFNFRRSLESGGSIVGFRDMGYLR